MIRIDVAKDAQRGHVDIMQLEGVWNSAVDERRGQPPSALLDFSNASYLDQEVLPYLVGLLRHRVEQRQRTQLKLPGSQRLIDFLRAWHLPEAIETACNVEFESLLDPASRSEFAIQKRRPPKYVVLATPGTGGLEELLPLSFFSLTPILLSDSTQAASLVRDRWLDAHLLSVLDLHLGGRANRLATNVLYEGILNAAMHPKACTAWTSAQILAKPRPTSTPIRRGERELVLTIWDDGNSFAETLSEAKKDFGTIVSGARGLDDDDFDVVVSDRRTGRSSRHHLDKEFAIDGLRRESLLTVAAFILGVTATPTRAGVEMDADDPRRGLLPPASLTHSGLGLHIIRKTVIDLFAGSIAYVSGSVRLSISSNNSMQGRYVANVTRRRVSDPILAGNLLVIRLRLPPVEVGR